MLLLFLLQYYCYCSTPLPVMKDTCIGTINKLGSKFDQLIYGIGDFVHRTICAGQRTARSGGSPCYYCNNITNIMFFCRWSVVDWQKGVSNVLMSPLWLFWGHATSLVTWPLNLPWPWAVSNRWSMKTMTRLLKVAFVNVHHVAKLVTPLEISCCKIVNTWQIVTKFETFVAVETIILN